ncbi:MAG TPA: ABC transporter ATP-binding protein [Candidatus Sulfotelmatobacter sp.]|nr:ABC transporter ATP-binding protein [Candidatus Sulfotelmatobacter sp.]
MYSLIWSLVKPYRGHLAVVLVAMVLQMVATVATPWPLKIVLDNVVGEHKLPRWLSDLLQPFFHHGTKMEIAAAAAIALVVIALVGAVASGIANYYTASVGQYIANDLRLRTYDHLQRLSLNYYSEHDLGTLLSTLTADVQTIQSFASGSTLDIVVDLLTILSMLAIMFWLNWDFTLIAVAITPFMLVIISRFKKAVKKAQKEVRKQQSNIVTVVQQGLESVRVIKAFGRQDLEQEELSEVSKATVDASLKARRVKAMLSPLVTVVVALCTAFVLWRSSSLILKGAMTAGSLTVFLSYLAQFFKPVKDLATMTNTIAQTAVGVDRIQAILSANDVIPEKPDAVDPGALKGNIEFENIVFGYNKDAHVLRDVSFKIGAGQMIGVVGPTGSGKSTIVSLIPRFYDPNAGRVTIDGNDLRDLSLRGLRSQIAYVLQETVLFRGSVADNIAYGKGTATRDEIIAAARLANADGFISQMPQGYDTMVGDRGDTLSGGQRQRIGIARAIIRDNPILVLDEPTAALDSESEKLVMEALTRLMKGRTVITIAHRLSTIRDADKIVVLTQGVLAEQGSHDELMALKGVYAGLYHAQFDEQVAAGRPAASTLVKG